MKSLIIAVELLGILCLVFSFYHPNDFQFGSQLRLYETSKIQQQLKEMKELTFVSSNPNKIAEVQLLLGANLPWTFRAQKFDLLEPQGSPLEISRMKCAEAARLCQGPVIVEDTSLCFEAFQGLPGPYIKRFFEKIGNQGLVNLLAAYENNDAEAKCALSFTTGPHADIHTFIGTMKGTIVSPQGPALFGWDPIFQVTSSILSTFLNV